MHSPGACIPYEECTLLSVSMVSLAAIDASMEGVEGHLRTYDRTKGVLPGAGDDEQDRGAVGRIARTPHPSIQVLPGFPRTRDVLLRGGVPAPHVAAV